MERVKVHYLEFCMAYGVTSKVVSQYPMIKYFTYLRTVTLNTVAYWKTYIIPMNLKITTKEYSFSLIISN